MYDLKIDRSDVTEIKIDKFYHIILDLKHNDTNDYDDLDNMKEKIYEILEIVLNEKKEKEEKKILKEVQQACDNYTDFLESYILMAKYEGYYNISDLLQITASLNSILNLQDTTGYLYLPPVSGDTLDFYPTLKYFFKILKKKREKSIYKKEIVFPFMNNK